MNEPLSFPPGPAARALERIRFHRPPSSQGGIARGPLIDRLEQAGDARVVLLLAPAGYGKTTLMVQWMERILRDEGRASWLTLDATDNDPARLMANLHGVLHESIDAPRHTLFLDEFEHVGGEPALGVARLLVSRLPPGLRLVISSRDKPALGLERLRVRGELLEMTAGELRFDLAETARFFAARAAAPLPAALLEKLHGMTDGWPAALQLTALAARTQGDLERYCADLSGSLAHIADYLAEDVLQSQSPQVRTFLLETCHLPRLCAAACGAATGRTDSAHMLHYLERHGLFTGALDASHSWYRYHPLFARFLQTQADRVLAPAQVVATHRGAARWFARHGAKVEAVDLWLLAGDSAAALREMAACARELVMQAQFGTIVGWIGRLDADALAAAGPELLLGAAWASGFMGDTGTAMQWLARLKPSLEAGRADDPLYHELMALEPVLIAMRGDNATALGRGLAHWQAIGPGHLFAAGALANVISYCLMLEGDFARARQFCAEARVRNEEIGSALGLGYALSVSGLIEAAQGNLDLALEQFGEVDKMTALRLRQPCFEATHFKMASVGLIASVLLETDRLDEADELLQRYFPLVMQQPSVDMSLLCHLVYARLKLAQGDAAAAEHILAGAERDVAAAWPFARARHLIESERIRIALAGGERARALPRRRAGTAGAGRAAPRRHLVCRTTVRRGHRVGAAGHRARPGRARAAAARRRHRPGANGRTALAPAQAAVAAHAGARRRRRRRWRARRAGRGAGDGLAHRRAAQFRRRGRASGHAAGAVAAALPGPARPGRRRDRLLAQPARRTGSAGARGRRVERARARHPAPAGHRHGQRNAGGQGFLVGQHGEMAYPPHPRQARGAQPQRGGVPRAPARPDRSLRRPRKNGMAIRTTVGGVEIKI